MDIYIRPLQVEDAAISYKWRNNPVIWKYTGHKPDKIISHQIEKRWLKDVLSQPDSLRFGICIKTTDEYIGNVQLTHLSNKEARFHIFIGEERYWGKGIATKATELILIHARDVLNLERIYLLVNPLNVAAIKAYENCGFTFIDESKGRMEIILINL